MKKLIIQFPILLKLLPISLNENKLFLMSVLEKNPLAFKYIVDYLKTSHDFLYLILNHSQNKKQEIIIKQLPKNIVNDMPFWIEYIQKTKDWSALHNAIFSMSKRVYIRYFLYGESNNKILSIDILKRLHQEQIEYDNLLLNINNMVYLEIQENYHKYGVYFMNKEIWEKILLVYQEKGKNTGLVSLPEKWKIEQKYAKLIQFIIKKPQFFKFLSKKFKSNKALLKPILDWHIDLFNKVNEDIQKDAWFIFTFFHELERATVSGGTPIRICELTEEEKEQRFKDRKREKLLEFIKEELKYDVIACLALARCANWERNYEALTYIPDYFKNDLHFWHIYLLYSQNDLFFFQNYIKKNAYLNSLDEVYHFSAWSYKRLIKELPEIMDKILLEHMISLKMKKHKKVIKI